MRHSAADVRLVDEAREAIGTVRMHAGSAMIDDDVTGAISRLLGFERSACYAIADRGDHFALSVLAARNMGGAMRDMSATLARSPAKYGCYDPRRPEPRQRNRATRLGDLGDLSPQAAALHARHGLDRLDQLRVLLCEGDALVAWLGGFREKPFSRRDVAAFNKIVPALRARCLLFARLDRGPIVEAALDAALDALGTSAFVVGTEGQIVFANAAGRRELVAHPSETAASVKGALERRGSRANVPVSGFAVTELAAPGMPRHYLFVRRLAGPADGARVACSAAKRWGITPRQATVLGLVASGLSNRAVAVTLGITEGTVELHVSALLARVGAESRAHLVARFWTES